MRTYITIQIYLKFLVIIVLMLSNWNVFLTKTMQDNITQNLVRIVIIFLIGKP